jgi:exopolysaccharide biosynthesis polyprenyl glycosylphosphotransferase
MFRRFSVNYALFSIGLDAILVCLALQVATQIRPLLDFLPFAAEYPHIIPTPWPIYPLFALIWTAILLLFAVYDGKRNLSRIDVFARLTLASLLSAVAMAGTLYLSYRMLSRLLFVVFMVLAYLGMLVWRNIAYFIEKLRKDRPERLRQVLIVGAGPVGRELQQQIQENPGAGLHVAGFLDDDLLNLAEEINFLGTIANASTIIQHRRIDDVVIALPKSAYKRTDQLIIELHRQPVKVWVIPDYFRMALHKSAVEEFAGIPMLDLRAPALSEYQRMVKRAFDLIVSIMTLPFALPVLGLIALAIRTESRGKILFTQPRVGENGHIFQMLKFRSMLPEAEEIRHTVEKFDEHGNLIHKSADDPRITKVGRFLRRFSLDELPQIFNVLKGEMSLVGPRPELPYLVEQYELWQRQRFSVPQGITGWWQINGRSDKPMHLNTEDDLYYVQHYSIFLDIYILLRTVGTVLQGRGAF